jgi:hypothetical protein
MWELLGSVKLPNSVAQVWDYFRDPLSYVTFEKWLIEALARLRTYRVLLAGWRCGVLRKVVPAAWRNGTVIIPCWVQLMGS